MRAKKLTKKDIYDVEFHDFLINLLRNRYPIKRIKNKKKFKRAILFKNASGEIPLFLSKETNQTIFNTLTKELYDIIGCNTKILSAAVFDYLYL